MLRAPVGVVEIQALYGNPDLFLRDDGTPSPLWDLRMVKVELPGPLPLGWKPDVVVRTCRVNEAIASEVDAVLQELRKRGAWDHVHTYDGGYCWRPKRNGSQKLSMHGYGAALDFNAGTNQMGTAGDIARVVVEVFEGNGWTWGGRWKQPDPMHFQYGRGY